MDNYSNAKVLFNQMISGMEEYSDLIGVQDENKKEKYGFVPGLNMPEAQKRYSEQAELIKEGVFQVMFTGAFSCGKTTLLNALMHKELLSMSINPETAIITKVIFGKDEEKIVVIKRSINKESGKHEVEEMDVNDFFKEYRVNQENPDIFINKIQYAVLYQTEEGIGGNMVQLVDSPGTQASAADNEVSRSFLEKTDAIVYMISAVTPFIMEDKEYIAKHFAGKQMKNLFFVINRIDAVNEDQIAALKENVRNQLRYVYTHDDGSFDEELFEKRVFYTNAYGSLLSRTNQKLKVMGQEFDVDDTKTGVPEFESALGVFLTDGGKDKASYQARLPQMARTYVEAEKSIDKTLKQYAEGIEKLEEDKKKIEISKNQVDQLINMISDSCQACASGIVEDAKREYDAMINRIDSNWEPYFTEKGTSLKLSMTAGLVLDTIKGVFKSDEEKQAALEKRMQPLSDDIQEYIKPEGKKLEKNISDKIDSRLSDLENQLKNIMAALENVDSPIPFDEIAQQLTSISTLGDVNTGQSGVEGSLFQILIGIIAADPETVIGGATGVAGSTGTVILKTVIKSVLGIVAWNVVAWPIGLAMLAGLVFHKIREGKINQKSGAMKILNSLKPNIVEEMQNNKDKFIMEIEQPVSAIIRAGNEMVSGFNDEIETYNTSLEKTISDLEKDSNAIAYEEERTNQIKSKLIEILSNLNESLNGAPLDEEGIRQLA